MKRKRTDKILQDTIFKWQVGEGKNTDLASSIGQALCKVPYIYHQWWESGKKKKKVEQKPWKIRTQRRKELLTKSNVKD